ncbi:MAG: hypothetical protein LBD31_04975 [Treponema sp.]|nr:hypothetical protein [Treponema sp.]
MKKPGYGRFLAGFFLFCWAVLSLPLGAQQRRQDPWWHTLELGKRYYRSGSYGSALRSFEDARNSRKNFYAKLERDLINLLSIHEVRRLGDDLSLVEVYIEKEFRVDAAAALRELYYRVPKESLHNSARQALAGLGRFKTYPEAEYWIGEVYRVEGETGIALGQYQKAYDERALLESPGFETEILYKIAGLRRMRGEYTEMVFALEEILKTDTLWSQESFNRTNMMRSLEANGINRFLLLFRHNSPAVERAHRLLGMYYYAYGRHNRAAEHLLFASLIQNTLIIEILKQDRYDYGFTGLEKLAEEAGRKRDLVSFIEDTEYFRTLYYLANSLHAGGRGGAAREIWTFLRDYGPGEWRGRSANQLRNPELDRIPEITGAPP